MKQLTLLLSLICSGQIHGQTITTIAGNGTAGFSGDGGPATSAMLNDPWGIALDNIGNIYIADFYNNRVRKVDTSGIMTTIAGNGTSGYTGDGGPAILAELFHPYEVAVNSKGNLFISVGGGAIRMVDTSGIISTITGNGMGGFSGDGGPASSAAITAAGGIAFDAVGNLFFSDYNNYRIRKIDTSGIITTIAGTSSAGYSGDGGLATSAKLNVPLGIIFDNVGNLFFADEYNHRIRKIDTTGIITTIAGNGTGGFSGDGGIGTSAELWYPYGISIDAYNNLFVADQNNNRIRKIDTLDVIGTVAGDGTMGFSGDGGLPTLAELNQPMAVTVNPKGDLYIADRLNHRVRKVIKDSMTTNEQIINGNTFTIYPNPTNSAFNIKSNTHNKLTLDLYDVNGRHVFSESVRDKENINVATLDNGVYTLTIKNNTGITYKKLVITH